MEVVVILVFCICIILKTYEAKIKGYMGEIFTEIL